MRYEWIQKSIRKKKFEIKYRRLAIYNAILFFVMAILLLTIAIIGFVNEIPNLTYIWILVAVAGFGIVGTLYSFISKQFIQPLDQTTERV